MIRWISRFLPVWVPPTVVWEDLNGSPSWRRLDGYWMTPRWWDCYVGVWLLRWRQDRYRQQLRQLQRQYGTTRTGVHNPTPRTPESRGAHSWALPERKPRDRKHPKETT